MNAQTPTYQRAEDLLRFSTAEKTPIIIQSEVSECGLTCLAMIAGYHGYETSMTVLRRKFSISSHGSTLRDIIAIAARLHFSSRALRTEPEYLSHIQLPCILHWGLNHFVVLTAIKHNKYSINDPACGERSLTAEEFNKEFTGVVLELIPTTEFRKFQEQEKLGLNQFWSRAIGFKRSLFQLLALSLLLQPFTVASPFYMQTVVDDVLLRQDKNLLMVLALGFGLLMLIQVATTMLRSYVVLHLSNRLAMQMSANLFRHLIRLPMDYFFKRHMGDIVSRFNSLSFVRNALTESLVAAVVDGIMASITLIVMFFYDVTLTLLVISIVILYGLLRWAFFRPSQELTQASIIATARENTHFMESMRAMQTIKLFQRENDRQNQWQNRLADVMNKNIELAKWGIWFAALNGILFGIENILVVYFAATSVMDNVMSLGMLYAFVSYKTNFKNSMDRLIVQWINFKMLDVYLNRLADIAFTKPENIEQHISQQDPLPQASNSNEKGNTAHSNVLPTPINTYHDIVGKIEIRNLAYRYSEAEEPIFKNLNFIINPGETVAITGPSGCGKTTLLKCLMGLIEPTEGEILIDDKPLKKLPQYRSKIASVMQDDQLLSGDISDNIACFASQPDQVKVEICSKIACIYTEIKKMPMHFHTLVGDMGSSLSGGQKQRVILARALYRQPRILFMDEATSHLDVANEANINANIKQLRITQVVVAHRLLTIKAADREIDITKHQTV